MTAGETMLTVTDAADITGSAIGVAVNDKTSPLGPGDTVTLIDAVGGLTSDQDGQRALGIEGIAKIFEFDLTTDANNLYATVAEIMSNDQVKALSEGRAAGLSFLGQGSGLIMGPGLGSLIAATSAGGLAPFGAVGGGAFTEKTGSHVDVSGVSILAGLGWRAPLDPKAGSLVAGAFFEAGWGSYTSYNSFSNLPSVKGKGDTS
jgi:hypothetical protein